jgi:hypothetical protein
MESILAHLVDPSFHTCKIEFPDRHSTPKGCSKSKGGLWMIGDEWENVKGSGVDEWSWVGKNQRICDDELEYRRGSRGYES